jgi:ligand-binding sensor domain-containing protein/signal transduction histidine kinase
MDMHSTIIKLLGLMLLLAHATGAQNFLRYDLKDGLPSAIIYRITQDQRGDLWLSTIGGGLVKFDGISFNVISERHGLAMNYVTDVRHGIDNKLWVATDNGISILEDSKITNLLTDSSGWNIIRYLAPDHAGQVWFTHPQGGLGYITYDLTIHAFSATPELDRAIVLQISYDTLQKTLWAATESTIIKIAHNKAKVVHTFKGKKINGFVVLNRVLVVATSEGVVEVDPDNGETSDAYPYLHGQNVTRIHKEQTSGILWAVANGNLYKNKTIINPGAKTVYTIFQDDEQNIWLGTDNGLMKYLGESITAFHPEVFNNHSITAITQSSDGDCLLASDNALFRYTGAFQKILDAKTFPALKNVTSITVQQNGTTWIGSRHGLIRMNANDIGLLTTSSGLNDNRVLALLTDKHDQVWMGTSKGLMTISNGSLKNFSVHHLLPEEPVSAIRESVDRIQFLTPQGIFEVENNQVTRRYYDHDAFLRRVNTFLEDNAGNIWLARSGFGVMRIDAATNEKTEITSTDGLTSDWILNMITDDRGNIIIGTNKGIDKIELDDKGNIIRVKSFFRREIQEIISTSFRSFFRDNTGKIWFGGRSQEKEGVYRYDPDAERRNNAAPKMHITYVNAMPHHSLFGFDLSLSDAERKTLPLAHYDNTLQFKFHASSLTYPEGVKYSYRLMGLTQEWSSPSTNRETTYASLAPGFYEFQVKAMNADGVWSTTTFFRFEILPPFWNTPWFYTTFITVLVLLVTGGIRYNVRRKIQQALALERMRQAETENIRKAISRDFHDNIGNKLAGIKIYSSLARNKINGHDLSVSALIQQIEKDTQSLFEGTRDFIWSIDPESDNLIEVFTYIKDFGQDFFDRCGIEFFSCMQGAASTNHKLAPGHSRHIVMIFKEAITNTAKHAGATHVKFLLALSNNDFEFCYEDNGHGFAPSSNRSGKGIRNMEARAHQIGCSFALVNNGAGKGITIRLKGRTLKRYTNDKTI